MSYVRVKTYCRSLYQKHSFPCCDTLQIEQAEPLWTATTGSDIGLSKNILRKKKKKKKTKPETNKKREGGGGGGVFVCAGARIPQGAKGKR